MTTEERVYTIPLRSKWQGKPRVRRANLSVDAVQGFLKKHMKVEDVKISQLLNESIWVRGAKKPPAFAKVKVLRDEEGVVTAMLPTEAVETTEKKGIKEKLLRTKGKEETKLVKGDGKTEAAPKAEASKSGQTKVETPKAPTEPKTPSPQIEQTKKK